MSITIYLFETRSIQSYLFEGGKLRDMVAASNQLDALCKAPLDEVLNTLGLTVGEEISFSRRAGGAIYAVVNDENKANQLKNLWSLYVRKALPGVEIVQVIKTDQDITSAMKGALDELALQRNRLTTQFPIPGPLALLSPRTGKAAIAIDRARDEWVDEANEAKIRYAKTHYTDNLVQKFCPSSPSSAWPTNLELGNHEGAFPFMDEDRTIALIHADGNGLGEILRVLNTAASEIYEKTKDNNHYIGLYQKFSSGLENAVIRAAQTATQKHLLPAMVNGTIPARPLVLGGDDITLLVRADLALDFTETFCHAFEQAAAEEMQPLRDQLEKHLGKQDSFEKLSCLTACAGISYIKASRPFAQAHHLSETLCTSAKTHSKQQANGGKIPASVSFHKVSSALIEDVSQVETHEWTVSDKDQQYKLSMLAYSLDDSFTPLSTLKEMATLFDSGKLNRNALRETASIVKTSFSVAEKRYQRWRDISQRQSASALAEFDRLLAKLILHDKPDSGLPFGPKRHLSDSGENDSLICNYSPLADLLAITSLALQTATEA